MISVGIKAGCILACRLLKHWSTSAFIDIRLENIITAFFVEILAVNSW